MMPAPLTYAANFAPLLVPIACAVLALRGAPYAVRAAVPASCILIVSFLSVDRVAGTRWFLVAALALSIVGDWFLSHRGLSSARFLWGVAFFFAAHAGFFAFCLANGRVVWPLLAALLVGYGLIFLFRLLPGIQGALLATAALCYLTISCFSLAAAPALRLPPLRVCLYTAGVLCLVLSDTLIALYEFRREGVWLYRRFMMPLYYAAHILITASVMGR